MTFRIDEVAKIPTKQVPSSPLHEEQRELANLRAEFEAAKGAGFFAQMHRAKHQMKKLEGAAWLRANPDVFRLLSQEEWATYQSWYTRSDTNIETGKTTSTLPPEILGLIRGWATIFESLELRRRERRYAIFGHLDQKIAILASWTEEEQKVLDLLEIREILHLAYRCRQIRKSYDALAWGLVGGLIFGFCLVAICAIFVIQFLEFSISPSEKGSGAAVFGIFILGAVIGGLIASQLALYLRRKLGKKLYRDHPLAAEADVWERLG